MNRRQFEKHFAERFDENIEISVNWVLAEIRRLWAQVDVNELALTYPPVLAAVTDTVIAGKSRAVHAAWVYGAVLAAGLGIYFDLDTQRARAGVPVRSTFDRATPGFNVAPWLAALPVAQTGVALSVLNNAAIPGTLSAIKSGMPAADAVALSANRAANTASTEVARMGRQVLWDELTSDDAPQVPDWVDRPDRPQRPQFSFEELDEFFQDADVLGDIEPPPVERPVDDIDRPVFEAWRRVANAGACDWCIALSSRGAIYRSEAAAVTSRRGGAYHTSCRCTAHLETNRSRWREFTVAEEDLREIRLRGGQWTADLRDPNSPIGRYRVDELSKPLVTREDLELYRLFTGVAA